MNPLDILTKYYNSDSKTFEILVIHGRQVGQKALQAAEKVAELQPDLEFLEKAAMLHDVGICRTNTPQLGCRGVHPYIRHGVLGSGLLIESGLPDYALVCERHVGVGIRIDDVLRFNLPLPHRQMVPVSIEEQIICYADKFFSKIGNGYEAAPEKSVGEIIADLGKYGEDKVTRFKKWVEMFGGS